MTVTGLFFLPLPPNAAPSSSSSSSITPALASHISRKYLTASAPLPPYQVIHHLLVDTLSLLPNHPISTHPRRYTQFLTLSHHQPGKTYVGTSSSSSPATTTTTSSSASSDPTAPAPAITAPPANPPAPAPLSAPPPKMTIIAVPTGPPAEDLFWTVTRKMEPLWAFRSTLRVDHGVAFSLLGDDWRLRLGDVRIAAGPGQGRVRGVLAELEFRGLHAVNGSGAGGGGGVPGRFPSGGGTTTKAVDDGAQEDGDAAGVGDWEGAEKMLRSFWDGIIDGSGVGVGMVDRLQVVVRVRGAEAPGEAEADEFTLVRQYMELLRFARA